MAKLIIFLSIQLMVIAPLVALGLNKPDYKWKTLILFVIYYFFYASFLSLPFLFPETKIIQSDNWNWSGKILAIAGSLLFYWLFKKTFTDIDYITFKQRKKSLKPALFITIFVFLLAIGLAFLCVKKSDEKLEYFLFQFTMPGIDEELAFRGIMMGLLSNSLKSKIKIGSVYLGNPALLITSILFGLGHSLQIDNDWTVHQNWFEFFNTFAIGLLLGWMTIKSGSILMSTLTHGLINVLPKIIFWI
ncbi:MAG TPA: CPBP family glutamic-type intramembrane protease [Saprospiraceae bacterium]|nr:CPBP family glutamic-type intramembrane protease [Saprospiraceae bacterium]HRF37277.1 CPBP family glutamic-type intramembrane protease [Saprospiraceae bacterium]HRJ15902.1 CPBP family glutamic-type intramembrane protease [Saprospiraceae bacterium]HRK82178.1 CPBP family glutamic-type intramembrane protease [Saprospiraceae bacterium]